MGQSSSKGQPCKKTKECTGMGLGFDDFYWNANINKDNVCVDKKCAKGPAGSPANNSSDSPAKNSSDCEHNENLENGKCVLKPGGCITQADCMSPTQECIAGFCQEKVQEGETESDKDKDSTQSGSTQSDNAYDSERPFTLHQGDMFMRVRPGHKEDAYMTDKGEPTAFIALTGFCGPDAPANEVALRIEGSETYLTAHVNKQASFQKTLGSLSYRAKPYSYPEHKRACFIMNHNSDGTATFASALLKGKYMRSVGGDEVKEKEPSDGKDHHKFTIKYV